MPTYHLVAMNPNVAVMTGTTVETSDMVKVLSLDAADAKAALVAGAERAASGGYRILAVGLPGELLVPANASKGVEPIGEAFPLDARLSGENAFHVDLGAFIDRGDQPGDFMANRADWDKPIRVVGYGGEQYGLERIGKSWGGAGYGFRRGGAVDEDYVVGEGPDAVILSVRRDKDTVAAAGRLRSFIPEPGAERTWFHSRGGAQFVAASALASAVRHARGLDPTIDPETASPAP